MSLQVASAQLRGQPETPSLTSAGLQEPHMIFSSWTPRPLESWVLQAFSDGEWRDQYAFTVEPFYAPDFDVINWHIATNPRSPFSTRRYAARTTVRLLVGLSNERRPDLLLRDRADESLDGVHVLPSA